MVASELNDMLDQFGTVLGTTGAERRSAALTAAEHAIAGSWEAELGDVLDTLGLRGAS